ncbi:hypothetical protein [Spongiactinospora sp. 9N601]|uniref:hypothetical protein n=1 Tax=Spongiactinospora sp. 9N601 TaxID=3375149 RepID=UPI0037A6DC7A
MATTPQEGTSDGVSRNRISGGTVHGPVIQARSVTLHAAGWPFTEPATGAARVARTLPRNPAAFTGRTPELQVLQDAVPQALAGPETGRVVVIHAINGMPGVGKTALAVHAAHQMTDRFPDGQLFVDLLAHTTGQQPADPANVLESLLRADGVHPGAIPPHLAERSGPRCGETGYPASACCSSWTTPPVRAKWNRCSPARPVAWC